MTELCTPVVLNVQVNIVPFGTINIIGLNYSDCNLPQIDEKEQLAFVVPTGSVISGTILYENLSVLPKSQ